jgi:hypothetical protein
VEVISYITVNLFLFSSWYIFLFQKREFLSYPDRIIGTIVLGLSQIIATEIVLGIVVRKLHALPLFSLNIAVSLIIIGLLLMKCRRDKNENARGNQSIFQGIFKEMRDKSASLFRTIRSDIVLLAIVSLFTVSMIWTIFQGLLFPSYTWDALWYHLPIVGYIMESGAIQNIPNDFFIHQFINIFPKNMELFFLWNVIFLKSDVIVDLSQVLFIICGILSVYSMAIKLHIQSKYAMYSAFLFFFTPIIILQATTNYVDVAISVLFLMAVNYFISDSRDSSNRELGKFSYLNQRKINLLLGGLATGILLGSKGSGPLFVALLSFIVIIQKLRRHYFTSNAQYTALRSVKYFLFYFFLPAVLLGGYWYGKNWIAYNNPVYPMEITILGKTIFEGLYKGFVEPAPQIINELSYLTRPVYVWMENIQYYMYDSRLGGLGPLWFILFLPSILFTFIYSLIKRRYDLLSVILIFIVAFMMYPRNWTPRYVMFIIGLGALSFGCAMNYFSGGRRVMQIMSLLLVVYTFMTSNSPCITFSQVNKLHSLPAHERTLARMAPFNIDLHARQEYGYWIWISDNISTGDTLAYTFEPLFLSPLWNSSFTNKVTYVKADSFSEWKKKLNANSTDYIVIKTNSVEDGWIEKERQMGYSLGWLGQVHEKFKVLYSDENYKILKFRRGKG